MTLWMNRAIQSGKHYGIFSFFFLFSAIFVFFSSIFLVFFFQLLFYYCRLLVFFSTFRRRKTQIYFYRLIMFSVCFFFGSATLGAERKGVFWFLDVCVFCLIGKRLDELSLVHCVQPVNVNGSIYTPIYICIQTHTRIHVR